MSRHHDPDVLDPATLAELDALEAALRGEGTHPEWAALVAAVREEPPPPRPGFARELDERVGAGFPRRRPAWLRLPAMRSALLPGLAAAACLVLVLTVVGLGSLAGGGEDQEAASAGSTASAPESSPGGGPAEPAPAPPPAAGAAPLADSAGAASTADPSSARGTAPLVPTPAPADLSRRDRRVERTASLALRTGAGKLQDAANGIVRATQDSGGVVESSSVDSSPDGGGATFVLRVPTSRLDSALERFAALADVRRMTQGAQDVTGAFVSAQDRLSDARAERKALLAALGRASTPRAIASLRARIAGNRSQIARLEGDLRGLRRRTNTTRIDVTLDGSGTAAAEADEGGAWGPADAARDAQRVLEVLAGVALVAGAALVPVAVLGGGAALAGRGLRRRRREGALGAS